MSDPNQPPQQVPPSQQAPQGPGWPAYSPAPKPTVGPDGKPLRPGVVTAGAIIAIVGSALGICGILAVALIAVAFGAFFSLLATSEGNLPTDDWWGDLMGSGAGMVVIIAIVVVLVLVLWSIAAIWLAVRTMRGSNSARIALVVSSIVAALICLATLVGGNFFSIFNLAACIATAVLLLLTEATQWFEAVKRASS